MGACSGSETQTVAVAPPSQVVPLSWSGELGAADKQLFMLHKVSPTLAKVFQTVDASEYGNFGCISCHGLMRELPSEFLPELNVEQGQITAFVDQPQIAQFMKDQVVPAMLQVMGTAEYGAQNRAWSAEANFGCAGCHRLSAPLKPFP